jgi:uncharacterized protein
MAAGMNNYRDFFDAPQNEVPVQGFLHLSPNLGGDCLVLTHGAGTNCESPLLVALADAFCTSELTVLRCDLPFRQLRPHGPPQHGSAERDQRGLRAAIASMRRQTSGRVFLGGHSYGGRQASMLAASESGLVDELLLLSYPHARWIWLHRRSGRCVEAHPGTHRTASSHWFGARTRNEAES